MSQTKLLTRS